MKNKTLIILFSILIGYSCSEEIESDPKVGDMWIMHYTDYNESGGIDNESDITVTTTEIIFNNESWVQLNTSIGSLGIFKMKSDGFHHLSEGIIDELFFTFPGNVGDSTYLHLDGENYLHQTIAVNQLTNLTYGDYVTNFYTQYDDNSLEANIWFTENEWFVKFEEFDETTTGPPGIFMDYKYEIVSYTDN